MQVKSIAECSNGSILRYFRPSLSYHMSLRPLFLQQLQCLDVFLHKKPCRTLLTAMFFTIKTPCINQALHVLLMHGFCILHIRILGHHKKLAPSTVTCIEMNGILWC